MIGAVASCLMPVYVFCRIHLRHVEIVRFCSPPTHSVVGRLLFFLFNCMLSSGTLIMLGLHRVLGVQYCC